MATLKYEDQNIEVAEDWRIGELIEAENALGIDMETARGGAKMALVLYISLRRVKPDLDADSLANLVRHMELGAFGDTADEEQAGPLDADAAADVPPSETAEPQIGGRPPWVKSA